jgi:hypothetical protein
MHITLHGSLDSSATCGRHTWGCVIYTASVHTLCVSHGMGDTETLLHDSKYRWKDNDECRWKSDGSNCRWKSDGSNCRWKSNRSLQGAGGTLAISLHHRTSSLHQCGKPQCITLSFFPAKHWLSAKIIAVLREGGDTPSWDQNDMRAFISFAVEGLCMHNAIGGV